MSRKWNYNIHHKKCRSNGGTDDESNLVRVPSHLHEAWHLLFKNWKTDMIVKFLNEVWLDPDDQIMAVPKSSKTYDEGGGIL